MPEVDGTIELWVEKDGSWTLAEYTEDGAYIVAEIPYGAMAALIEVPEEGIPVTYYIIAAVAVLILVISIIIVHNKRRKKAK